MHAYANKPLPSPFPEEVLRVRKRGPTPDLTVSAYSSHHWEPWLLTASRAADVYCVAHCVRARAPPPAGRPGGRGQRAGGWEREADSPEVAGLMSCGANI